MTKKRKILVVLIIILVVPIITIGVLYAKFENDYKEASIMFEEGDYTGYLNNMEHLDFYIKTEEDRNRVDYATAMRMLDLGKFDDAYELFTKISSFKDSENRAKESLYYMARVHIQNSNWNQASEIFALIEDYNDSSELLKYCKYNYAMDLIRSKKLTSAVDVLKTIQGYADSDEYIQKCLYKIGELSYEEGNFEEARKIFEGLGDYENSRHILQQMIINEKLSITNTNFPDPVDIQAIPKSTQDLIQILRYMIYNNQLKYSITYYSEVDTDELSENLYEAYLYVISNYVEEFSHIDFYNTDVYLNDSNNQVLTIRLGNSSIAKMKTHLKEFRSESYEIILDLIESGKLKPSMSQRDMAKVLYIWVAQNLRYDYSFGDESFSGYGAVNSGLAVCNGYTALYNQLCKIVGIDVIGVHGIVDPKSDQPDHIWTYANLDGNKTYIDVTWGDPSPYDDETYDLDYFAVDESFMRKSRRWDVDKFILD